MSNPLPMPPSASAADPLMTTLPPATLIVSVAWMAPAHVAESLNPCLHTRKGRQMRQEGFPAEPLLRLYASVALSIFKRFLSQQSASGHDWTAPGYCQTLGLAGSFGQTSCWKRAWRVNGWLHCNAGADSCRHQDSRISRRNFSLPAGGADWCDALQNTMFTAGDCFSLHEDSSVETCYATASANNPPHRTAEPIHYALRATSWGSLAHVPLPMPAFLKARDSLMTTLPPEMAMLVA